MFLASNLRFFEKKKKKKVEVEFFFSLTEKKNFKKLSKKSKNETHICWVSSGTVSALYCCEPRDVSGAKPTMKKCRRGKGIRLTASLRRSELSWPGKRRQQVTPDITAETRWLRSPNVGVVSLSVRKQMSYSASLSRT